MTKWNRLLLLPVLQELIAGKKYLEELFVMFFLQK